MSRGKKTFNMELFFQALGDRTRLRLIHLMGDDEVCVCFLVEVLRTNQPKISRHLAYLRKAGLVSARRDGKWMHYRLETPPNEHAARMLVQVREWIAGEREMQSDRERLVKVCCGPTVTIQLERAPRPASLVA